MGSKKRREKNRIKKTRRSKLMKQRYQKYKDSVQSGYPDAELPLHPEEIPTDDDRYEETLEDNSECIVNSELNSYTPKRAFSQNRVDLEQMEFRQVIVLEMAEPSSYQVEEPSSYQVEKPSSYQVEEQSSYQVEETSSYQVEETSSYQVEEPSSYQVEEPSNWPVKATTLADTGTEEFKKFNLLHKGKIYDYHSNSFAIPDKNETECSTLVSSINELNNQLSPAVRIKKIASKLTHKEHDQNERPNFQQPLNYPAERGDPCHASVSSISEEYQQKFDGDSMPTAVKRARLQDFPDLFSNKSFKSCGEQSEDSKCSSVSSPVSWNDDDSGSDIYQLSANSTTSDTIKDEMRWSYQFDKELNIKQDRKYIVFEAALLQLFMFCRECFTECTSVKTSTMGSMLTVCTVCPLGHEFTWNSQPTIGSEPAGDVLTAASIFFSGLNPSKVLRMFNFCGIQIQDIQKYYHSQKADLFRAVKNVWDSEQKEILDSIKDKPLELGGMVCSNYSKFRAKFGGYSLVECGINKVIHLVFFHSEVKSSVTRELEGLKQGLKYFMENGMNISSISTGRHLQVQQYLKENYPTISHFFNCWNFVKSIKRGIDKACEKQKTMQIVLNWSKCIQNYIYWLASSTSFNAVLMIAKWTSLLRHITNQHTHHGEPFDACVHEKLESNSTNTPTQWINPASPAFNLLEKFIRNQTKDIPYISSPYRSIPIEAFHSVAMEFVPKHNNFNFIGMEERFLLAALHYNENSEKIKASIVNQWNDDILRCKLQIYSPSYDYVQRIMDKVVEYATEFNTYS